jgi:hypothetical protein
MAMSGAVRAASALQPAPAKVGSTATARLHRKLALGQVNDGFEVEADRIAGHVAGGAAPVALRSPPVVQRAPSGGPSNGEVPAIVGEVLSASAQPLDRQTRSFMEQRFGHDFGHVRVHLDAKAADSAKSVQAQAYAVGSHVVFGAGRYAPDTEEGRRLIAHELTHVVQQTGTLARKPAAPLATDAAAAVPPARRLENLAAVLETYAMQADAQVAASGATAIAIGRVRTHLGELRAGATRLRQLAASGDSAACSAALSGFTAVRLREASRSLVPAGAVDSRIAVTEMTPHGLTAKSLDIGAAHGPAESEADRIADAVVAGRVVPAATQSASPQIQRLFDAQAAQQLEQNAPVIITAAGAATEGALITAGAIAAGGGPPGWVIGLAIVAVVAVLAVGGYLYYRSLQPDPQPLPLPRPQPDPNPNPNPDPDPPTRRRPPFVLRLPQQKAPHLRTYRNWLGVLQSDPNYLRGNPGQLEMWHQELRIGGANAIPASVYERGHRLGFTGEDGERQIRVPGWSGTRSTPMEVDHVVELQVTPAVMRPLFNSIDNFELLDRAANGTSGPLLAANIAAERAIQVAFDPTAAGRVLFFDRVEMDGGGPGERWSVEQIRAGRQLDIYEATRAH